MSPPGAAGPYPMTHADQVRRSYEAYAADDRGFFEQLVADDFRFWSP